MNLPRTLPVAVEDTPYYPIVSRCVRRSYLCGIDAYSGKDYDLFLLFDNYSCVVLISYIHVTMHCSTFRAQNRCIHAVMRESHFA
jgi:hypothetical protein